MIITPAILPQDYEDLQGKLSRLKGLCRSVQIDACDGKFTPKPTWPYINDREGHFQKILNQEEGLPSWDSFDFETDLMVKHPEIEYARWIDAGASRVVVHHYLGQEERTKKTLSEIKDRGCVPVISFGYDANISDILGYKDDEHDYLKNIQIMGIRNIGFQGEQFQMETIDKVKMIKEKFPDCEITIDGGVNEESAPLLVDAGVNRLVIGSALFNSGDLNEALKYFESL